jgi:Fe2+ or Zn2+ uptake regulation protein
MKQAKEEFERYLEGRGLRATARRSLILGVFLKTEKHLTAEELYRLVSRKDPSVGQATVYRTLRLLVDSGIAREVDFGDGMSRRWLTRGSRGSRSGWRLTTASPSRATPWTSSASAGNAGEGSGHEDLFLALR